VLRRNIFNISFNPAGLENIHEHLAEPIGQMYENLPVSVPISTPHWQEKSI